MQTHDYDPEDLQVQIAELLVATADHADDAIDPPVQQVLRLLREKLAMDVVFVSEFTHGQRVIRRLEQGPQLLHVGASDALEASWCHHIVDGRLPRYIADGEKLKAEGRAPATPIRIGTHLSVPIVLRNGEVYGTLCCFSQYVNGKVNADDLKTLAHTAQLTAERLQGRG